MPTIPSSALPDDEGHERLATLGGGITPDALREAMHRGYTHAASCTSNDPVIMPGVTIWGKGTGALRDLQKPRGWMPKRTENLELTVSPDKRVALIVAAGTSGVGRRDLRPRTRTPKGPATGRVIQQNEQLRFAGDPAFEEDEGKWQTWLLLHYYDKNTGEIRIELSCPAEMMGKQVTAWRERILLKPVEFATELDLDIEDEPDDDIDVDITRRAN